MVVLSLLEARGVLLADPLSQSTLACMMHDLLYLASAHLTFAWDVQKMQSCADAISCSLSHGAFQGQMYTHIHDGGLPV